MTEEEFRKLPNLVFARHVQRVAGYNKTTLTKMIDCGVLKVIAPKGSDMRRFQKRQLAALVGLSMDEERKRFSYEPLLMSEKSALFWTGLSRSALARIVQKRGLHQVRPAGLTNVRYPKGEIAQLIGFELA